MDNIQFWIYVILGVIYLIGRASKKKKEEERQPTRRQNSDSQPSGPKPLTFEELLKEITEAKMPEPEKEVVTKKQTYQEYEEETVPEYKSYDTVKEETYEEPKGYDFEKEETYKTFEKSRFEAFNRKSYEELQLEGALESPKVEYKKFKEFEKEEGISLASQIAEDFADMDKVKRAFIMAEVFNRKY
ncbi:MAG: hypothetical protein O9302_09080 [Cyclobacteriaceae bacterium]|jgi:hypothetical protein|nr:hypothetical protein [Flammeovirgaceae bacterium]MCZ8022901.1 hypothetical protein [Cytophagales bacterium]MCZ8328198.1 hypothetical protein [Cyclobacteriaceae bacterium]